LIDLAKPKKKVEKDEKKGNKYPKFVVENSPIDRFYKLYIEPENNMQTPRFMQHICGSKLSSCSPFKGGSDLGSFSKDYRSSSPIIRQDRAINILKGANGLEEIVDIASKNEDA
jgi:hypothetical protein